MASPLEMQQTPESGLWRDEVTRLEIQLQELRDAVERNAPRMLARPVPTPRPVIPSPEPSLELPSPCSSQDVQRQYHEQRHSNNVLNDSAEGGHEAAAELQLQATAQPSSPMSSPPAGQLMEMFRELETLELALVQERNKVNSLTEEKAAREESHARDIAELEGMLQYATTEQDKLRSENDRLRAEMATVRAIGDKEAVCSPADMTTTTSCSASEPEMEFSGNSIFNRMVEHIRN
mmetsp:Transcript_674/g.1316  ORF Transcript_674/g.1316 Transcript_674/m.1316 type:complete len:235 (-) Transcript_674:57-761(-)